MLSDPALDLLHEYPDEGLQIIPVVDRRDRRVIPITVDICVELVSTSRRTRSNVWSSAPDNDGPWSNAAVLNRLMGFIVKPGQMISNQQV